MAPSWALVASAFNLGIQETVTGGSLRVQGQPVLPRETLSKKQNKKKEECLHVK